MHPILVKSFGGLTRAYYFRQLFFGIVLAAIFIVMITRGTAPLPIVLAIVLAVNTFLYPYARFVYESVVSFVMGDNVFFVSAGSMLFAKLMTMILCFFLAIFIAPVGLAYLYYRHSRAAQP